MSYQTLKKFNDICVHFNTTTERDRQTDRGTEISGQYRTLLYRRAIKIHGLADI